MTVDKETLDALRVVRNLAATSGLDVDTPEWKCIYIVTDRFGLAETHSAGHNFVPHPIERFRTEPTEEEE